MPWWPTSRALGTNCSPTAQIAHALLPLVRGTGSPKTAMLWALPEASRYRTNACCTKNSAAPLPDRVTVR
eukprot:13731585-Alexandrium_andersonii.AAC.1